MQCTCNFETRGLLTTTETEENVPHIDRFASPTKSLYSLQLISHFVHRNVGCGKLGWRLTLWAGLYRPCVQATVGSKGQVPSPFIGTYLGGLTIIVQGAPSVVPLNTASVTACPRGCRLCKRYSCHAEGHSVFSWRARKCSLQTCLWK